MLVCGLLVLSVGITGVCGVVQNTRGWLTLFTGLVLVLLTVESVACVLILLYQPGLLANMRKVVQARLIHDYGREGYESFTTGIDWVQYSLSCCGVVSPADYQNSLTSAWRRSNLSHHRLEVPLTCCSLLNKGVRTLSNEDSVTSVSYFVSFPVVADNPISSLPNFVPFTTNL